MKTVPKILEYQKVIIQLLSNRPYNLLEIEDICLPQQRTERIACYENLEHALKDLIANGKINQYQDTFTINQ